MSPKEKALDLYNKFNSIKHSVSTRRQRERSIQCALICVEEILEHCKELPIGGIYEETKDYYLKVKEELLKL